MRRKEKEESKREREKGEYQPIQVVSYSYILSCIARCNELTARLRHQNSEPTWTALEAKAQAQAFWRLCTGDEVKRVGFKLSKKRICRLSSCPCSPSPLSLSGDPPSSSSCLLCRRFEAPLVYWFIQPWLYPPLPADPPMMLDRMKQSNKYIHIRFCCNASLSEAFFRAKWWLEYIERDPI